MSWLRLDAYFFQDESILDVGLDGAIVFLAAITMAKLHDCRGGRLKASRLTPRSIRHHLGLNRNDRNSDVRYSEAVKCCVDVGLLELEEGGRHFVIAKWEKYQSDPTNAARQKRHRDKPSLGVTGSNAPTVRSTVGGEGAESATASAPKKPTKARKPFVYDESYAPREPRKRTVVPLSQRRAVNDAT